MAWIRTFFIIFLMTTSSIFYSYGNDSPTEEKQSQIKRLLESGKGYFNGMTNDIRDRLLASMERDLAACPGETKSLDDIGFSQLMNPNETCREACGEKGYNDNDFKYSGSAVKCCCKK